MSRASWKNFFLTDLFLQNYIKKKINKKFDLKIKNKNIVILPLFLNMICKIYNGKQYIKLLITKDMIGYKFGEFIPTRKNKLKKNVKKQK